MILHSTLVQQLLLVLLVAPGRPHAERFQMHGSEPQMVLPPANCGWCGREQRVAERASLTSAHRLHAAQEG